MTKEDLQLYFTEQCTVSGNVIKLGQTQLSREDYLQIKKLLESRGGKWKGGKTSGFVFDSDAEMIYHRYAMVIWRTRRTCISSSRLRTRLRHDG